MGTVPNSIFRTGHGYRDGQGPFRITTGTPPNGLSFGVDYYIKQDTNSTMSCPSGVDIATDTIGTNAPHGYLSQAGPFRIRGIAPTGNDLEFPGGLDGFTNYFVTVVDADHFQVSTVSVGSIINITSAGVGTFEFFKAKVGLRDKFQLSLTPGGAPVTIVSSNQPLPWNFVSSPLSPPADALKTEIATTYLDAEIQDIRFAQSPERLYIVHKNHRPAQLTRIIQRTTDNPNGEWQLVDVDFIDGPFLDEGDGAATTTNHAFLGRCSVTASDLDAVNDGAGFGLDDIGRMIRLNDAGTAPGYIIIDSLPSSFKTVASGIVFQTIGGAPGALLEWHLGAWYGGNYPTTVALAEQRLCFSGEPTMPNFVSTSNTGSLNVMRTTAVDAAKSVVATNGVRFGIFDGQIHIVRWLTTSKKLLIGTNSAIFSLRGTLDGEPFGPNNTNSIKISSVGVSSLYPVNVALETAYVTKNSQGLRSIESNDGADSREEQKPFDLALLARHVFGRTLSIVDMDYQFDRRNIIWLARSDGVLLGCTYVPEEKIFAWHTHKLGGSFNNSGVVADHGLVESVSVDKNTGGSFDRVWLVVKRTLGTGEGATQVRHIEFFEDEWLDGVSSSQQFVDSHPAQHTPSSGPSASTFDTFGHLIGETVQVLGDGGVLPDVIVTEPTSGIGRVTTTKAHANLIAGLGYTSVFESLPLDLDDPEGASMGKMARPDHVVLRLFDSQAGEVGVNQWDGNVANWTNIIERQAGDVFGSPAAPFTGDIKVILDGGFDREKVIQIRQTLPVGFNLLAMNVMGSSGAR